MAMVPSARLFPFSHATADGVSSALTANMLRPVGRIRGFNTGSPPEVGAMKPPPRALTTESSSSSGLCMRAVRYLSTFIRACSTSLTAVANSSCSAVSDGFFVIGVPFPPPWGSPPPTTFLRAMAAFIFSMAASSAPILRAMAIAFSGVMPGSIPWCFFVAGRSETLRGFCFGEGIMAPMTIILDSMSFDPSTAFIMFLALSRSLGEMPAIRQIAASSITAPEATNPFACSRQRRRSPPRSFRRL